MTCGKTPVYFCICSEEWCWCTNRVGTPEEACPTCASGTHVMDPPPDKPRSQWGPLRRAYEENR